MAGSNHYIQPKTIYELDTSAYENVMGWIRKTALINRFWYRGDGSDYHFLRMAYPEEPVYLANTSTFFAPTNYARDVSTWDDAEQRWYGGRYVRNLAALKRLKGPWLFLSWETSDTIRTTGRGYGMTRICGGRLSINTRDIVFINSMRTIDQAENSKTVFLIVNADDYGYSEGVSRGIPRLQLV